MTTNIAIGEGAIAQVINIYGVSIELFEKYIKELAVTDTALLSFFKILNEQQVPRSDLDSKLREIAATHKELLLRLETVQSEDPQVVRLKGEARQAIELGEYAKAEELLNQAEARDVQTFEQLEANAKRDMEAARKRRISAAATNADQARAQRVQLRYAKAATYWQKAAALLPEESKEERAYCLGNAGYDLDRIAKYKEALPLLEQSLSILCEIGDKAGEGTTLNNIGQIYKAQEDYVTALRYLEQSLSISREIGYKEGECVTLNNIGQIYKKREDYVTALRYLEQSLSISREIGYKEGEGAALNNIGGIYKARRDYSKALVYLEQSLAIQQEIGNRYGQVFTNWSIGDTYAKQGDLSKSELYMIQTVQLAEKINHFDTEKYRKELKLTRKMLSLIELATGIDYERQGDLKQAEAHISRAIQLEEELGRPDQFRKTLERIRSKMRGPSFLGRISSFFTGR